MRKLRFLMPIGIFVIPAAFSAVVMLLWNWLMPFLFGLTTINFWQALGIFVLARILFGGFGFGKGKMMAHAHHHHHNAIREKWMKMTPEQRREFFNKRRAHGFGGFHGREDFFGEEMHKDCESRESENKNE